MTLLGHGHGHKSAEQQQEVREARRVLKEKIRDDWEYPPLPEWQAHSSGRRRGKARMGDEEERVAAFRFHAPPGRDEPECAAAMSWREREYSSESEAGEGNPVSATSAGSKASSKFRFEGPDSVGTEISQRRLARRRTRQRDLETEMTWNPGLAHWVRQRDVWSGATTTTTTNHVQIAHGNDPERPETASGASTPRTSSSHSDPASSPTTLRSSAATTPDPAPSSLDPIHPTTAPPLIIPIAPPFLPNHPIRRRITPAMYTEIYTKIIVQGRTPSVPINLLTLISALVEGWKADGEWPPKASPKASGPPEPSLARRKVGRKGEEGVVKMGVKAVGKVLRLGHGHGEGG